MYYCHCIKQFLTGQPPESNKKRGRLETHVSTVSLEEAKTFDLTRCNSLSIEMKTLTTG